MRSMENQPHPSSTHRITLAINGAALTAFNLLKTQNPNRSDASLASEILERSLTPHGPTEGAEQISIPPGLDLTHLAALRNEIEEIVDGQTRRLATEFSRSAVAEIRYARTSCDELVRKVDTYLTRQTQDAGIPLPHPPEGTSRRAKVALHCLLFGALSAQLWLTWTSSRNTRSTLGNLAITAQAIATQAQAIDAKLTANHDESNGHSLIQEKALATMVIQLQAMTKGSGQPQRTVTQPVAH